MKKYRHDIYKLPRTENDIPTHMPDDNNAIFAKDAYPQAAQNCWGIEDVDFEVETVNVERIEKLQKIRDLRDAEWYSYQIMRNDISEELRTDETEVRAWRQALKDVPEPYKNHETDSAHAVALDAVDIDTFTLPVKP